MCLHPDHQIGPLNFGIAGPVFNFILSILVFTGVLMLRGVASDPLTVGEVYELPGGFHELRTGDEILAINGSKTPGFDDQEAWSGFTRDIPAVAILNYDVQREGQVLSVDGPQLFPPLVQQVAPRSAALG